MNRARSAYGPVGRLGRWAAAHFKLVGLVWAIVAIGLATIGGLAHSGRVVFAAAAVMVAVFFTFALSGPLPPKEMGVILGVAVLLDAALVRLLLVPVALRLLGTWAWWLPKPLARVLPDVRFGHA
jgi:RND superfamily putative drug exporter